jgi:hypothetical protein
MLRAAIAEQQTRTSKPAADVVSPSARGQTASIVQALCKRLPASDPSGPQPSSSPFNPPRTLRDALSAAEDAALLELRHALPCGTEPAKLKSMLENGTAHNAAENGATLELMHFLDGEALDAVIEEVAEHAIERRIGELAVTTAAPLSVPTVTITEPVQPHDWSQENEEKDIAQAFLDACGVYLDEDFPRDVPFDALGHDVRELFVYRGRMLALETLEPVLPWEAAVRIAEALGEAAWYVCAPEESASGRQPTSDN